MKSFTWESKNKYRKYIVSQLENYFIRNREGKFQGKVAQEAKSEVRRLRKCLTTNIRMENDNLRPILSGFNKMSDGIKENFDEAITD